MKSVIKKISHFLKNYHSSKGYIKAGNPFLFTVAKQAIKGIGNEFQHPVYVDNQSEIGSHNYIGVNTAITKAKIGNYCSIAPNVSIGLGEHSLNSISTSHLFYEMPYDVLTAQSCEIGHDVWIGVDSIILRGVKIGNGVVIGANSVVTKDIPDFAIAVGSPAKVIKYRFTEGDAEKITLSNWWLNLDLQMAKQILKDLEIKLKKTDLIT